MMLFSDSLVVLVSLLHFYFLTLEMFLWRRPYGLKTFGLTPELAEATAPLAANQGLYNGFLALGLLWGVFLAQDPACGFHIKVFFLACVIIAGIYGAATVNKKIFFVQTVPALVALVASFVAARELA